MLSIILTAAVLYPDMSGGTIVAILAGGSLPAITVGVCVWILHHGRGQPAAPAVDRTQRAIWRMPPLTELPPVRLSLLNRTGMIVLRGYLVVAAGLVLIRIVQLALS
jgi:hypothetical protein